MRTLPRQPLGRPPRVRGLNVIVCERKRPPSRTIELGEVIRQQSSRRCGKRLPREQRSRISLRSRECRRECLEQLHGARARGFLGASTSARPRSIERPRARPPPESARQVTPARPDPPDSISQHGVNGFAWQLGAAVERHELDEERERMDAAALPLDEILRRARGAAGGKQVVDDQHAMP